MEQKNVRRLRRLLLSLACAAIVLGILSGEAEIVFTKAVNLCLECIGIG